MTTVNIHRFSLYDINSDSYRASRRWATRDVIEKLGGEILSGPSVEVDSSVVASDIEGMTVPEYDPFRAAAMRRAS
jgi:hypothetical protein